MSKLEHHRTKARTEAAWRELALSALRIVVSHPTVGDILWEAHKLRILNTKVGLDIVIDHIHHSLGYSHDIAFCEVSNSYGKLDLVENNIRITSQRPYSFFLDPARLVWKYTKEQEAATVHLRARLLSDPREFQPVNEVFGYLRNPELINRNYIETTDLRPRHRFSPQWYFKYISNKVTAPVYRIRLPAQHSGGQTET